MPRVLKAALTWSEVVDFSIPPTKTLVISPSLTCGVASLASISLSQIVCLELSTAYKI